MAFIELHEYRSKLLREPRQVFRTDLHLRAVVGYAHSRIVDSGDFLRDALRHGSGLRFQPVDRAGQEFIGLLHGASHPAGWLAFVVFVA